MTARKTNDYTLQSLNRQDKKRNGLTSRCVNSAEACDRAFLHQLMHVFKCECMLVSGGCGFIECHFVTISPPSHNPLKRIAFIIQWQQSLIGFLIWRVRVLFSGSLCASFPFPEPLLMLSWLVLLLRISRGIRRWKARRKIFTNVHIRHSSFAIITFRCSLH